METDKKKIKVNKKLIIGLVLILISTDKIFHYIGFKISDIFMGMILLLIGIFLLAPILFPRLTKEEPEEKTKPKVYFYSKEEISKLKSNIQNEQDKDGK